MMKKMKQNLITILLFVLDLLITSFVTVWMWNTIASGLLNAPTITLSQGWAVAFFISYFFKQKDRSKIDDWTKFILEDIAYTLLMWGVTAIICIFAF